ncbi:DUF1642 domain-containing protein [Streptococcus gordonii]|uniref:DUF1642 domain-containing protein n=1 Tax=Streptococcus gordonii TaxID=1302 RepID=UPI0020015E9B|nr:DUF1642 domain-containing protein [Streptococcus gordonii]
MNKQGLITMLMMEKISAEVKRRGKNYAKGYGKGIDLAIKLIEASEDEPQKPVVPKFVADWIKKNKGGLFGLNYDSVSNEIYDWVYEEEGNLKKLHLACAIGYTVEKEKRYLVKMKGMQKDCVALKKNKDGGYWYLSDTYPYGSTINIHTRKELEEAGFGWVFDCEGIEIKEVE